MVKQKKNKKKTTKNFPEADSAYILKIVLYVIVGSQWIRLTDSDFTQQIPLPFGLMLGLFFAMHDHFQIDRKIEYAVLFLASLIGFWTQVGLSVNLLQ